MKKQLLFGVALGIGGFAFGQSSGTNGVTPVKPGKAVANKVAFYKQNQSASNELNGFTALVNSLRPAQPAQTRAYTTTTIGTTGYQLQTNAAVMDRLLNHPDGTLSATWTYSAQSSSWTDRGTGYNYFNGSTWGPNPTARIENIRTGFTNIGVTSTGAEIVVSHEASDLHMASRPVKGTGTWNNATFLGSPDVWSRLAVGGANGTTLHVISQTTGTANPPFMGQDGALAYSRSLNGGVTWDKLHTIIPEIDVNSYLGFGGDSYSIDAKGDTIAIVIGGFDIDVVLIKSIDNGETWTKTIVNYFPIPLFDESQTLSDIDNDGLADTLTTNDASVHVLLDNQGKAHVWFGAMRMLNDDMSDGGVSYFPGTDGLMYWNESMGASTATVSKPVMITSALDIDNSGTLDVADWGTYQVSLTSLPSAGIDAAGNIYVSYAGIYEGIAELGAPAEGKSFRHTYVMRSNDGGATWCEPQDVTDPPGPSQQDYVEGVYTSMARRVDNFVHLLEQRDGYPGHGVSTDSPDAQGGDAEMVYIKVPVADLMVCAPVGVAENASALASFELYPNPANTNTNLSFTVVNKGKVSIRVMNVTGQVVAEIANQEFAAGTHTAVISLADLSAGIYVVNMTSADGTATKKLMVK
ncbi:MAG TPA: T9SS type A sorting domain-containing protein [Bacteroidia bacterium]|jgi:hypothetical protein